MRGQRLYLFHKFNYILTVPTLTMLIHSGAVEIMCRTMDMISAKVIRLTDLSVLSKLPEMGCRNYKILHLVRDPRPIVQSRIVSYQNLILDMNFLIQ